MSPTNQSSELQEVVPRPAATLVIMRDSRHGPEVLLTVRPDTMRFMAGAVVFPGGAVASADHDLGWEKASARSAAEAAAALDSEEPTLALGSFIAALRESYEEVGLILGEGPVDELARADGESPQRFFERCIELGIVLSTDELVPAGRWVTPLGSPIRFDTRFFVTRAPDGWEPDPDPEEVAGTSWSTPAQALLELSSGRAIMAPPTVEMLQLLERFASVSEAVASLSQEEGVGQPGILSVRLSPAVHVVLAPNPGVMTGPGTNTYIVGTGPTVVIDPAASDPDYLDTVVRIAGEVESILITHRHSDHVGGAARLAGMTDAPVRAFGSELAGDAPVDPLEDGDVIEVPGASLRVLHCPGHASDHLCFYLEGTASLFAGDNVLGEGTAVIAPPDGDMSDYLATLRRLRELHIDRIYPGHFRPLDGGERIIEGYLSHRKAREDQIVATLTSGPRRAEEIVEEVYTDTPAQLHPIAAFQVAGHLEMLEDEGRVTRDGDRWALR